MMMQSPAFRVEEEDNKEKAEIHDLRELMQYQGEVNLTGDAPSALSNGLLTEVCYPFAEDCTASKHLDEYGFQVAFFLGYPMLG